MQGSSEAKKIKTAYDYYIKSKDKLSDKISKCEIFILIALWSVSANPFEEEIADVKLFEEIVNSGILKLIDENGNPLPLGAPDKWDHQDIIDKIRCNDKWSMQKKEELVTAYCTFAGFLKIFTYNLIKDIIDSDRNRSRGRSLPFDTFIKLLDFLTIRDRSIAKILYFGAPSNLDEVLSLKIEQIDFYRDGIDFESGWRSYPVHVMYDIKKNIDNRTEGYVFCSKQGKKIRFYRSLSCNKKCGNFFEPRSFIFSEAYSRFSKKTQYLIK